MDNSWEKEFFKEFRIEVDGKSFWPTRDIAEERIMEFISKELDKAHRVGREEMREKITKTLPKKDPQYLRKLNSETEATWDERAERGKVNYNYGWNDLLDKFNELLKKEF